MAIVVQKIAIAFIVNNEVNVNETRRADTRMTSAEYDGDNPLRLANEIDAALAKYGLAFVIGWLTSRLRARIGWATRDAV